MNVFKQALVNIWRDKGISFAALLVTTLTFFVTTVFVLVALSSHVTLDYLESRAQLTAFFKPETLEEDILELKSRLEQSASVLEVTYTSKEQALEIYRQDYQDEPALLESISANIFPASLDIRAEDIEKLDSISQVLNNNELVEEVVYFQDVAQNFKQVSDAIRSGGLVLVAVFAAISLFIILLAIGVSIHSKKEEIEIMRLLGAGKWYIRAPFLLQGAFYGLGAVLVSLAIVAGLGVYFYPQLTSLLRDVPLPEVTPVLALEVVGGELLGAAFLGMLAAYLATRKYLKA
ncbi:MAG: permease-like cell division protein FtsX [Patescibacteria group bacterium]|nr:permease-like cell division protein FtsX [Patescibacteria group bacterium]